jgi:hypothetical protein
VFASRRLSSPEARAAAEEAETRRLRRESASAADAQRPAPSAESAGRLQSPRERSSRHKLDLSLSPLFGRRAPQTQAQVAQPRAERAPRELRTRAADREPASSRFRRPSAPPAEESLELPELRHMLELGLDSNLDTSDVASCPLRWSELSSVPSAAQLLQSHSAELRAMSGVESEEEWALLLAQAARGWEAFQKRERRRQMILHGASLLPHAQAEEEALGGVLLAAGLQGGRRTFAESALMSLSHNPGWSYAAKARAASLLAQRLSAAG